MPWINDTKFFFFNKQMLADAGITTPPKTWDDVVTAAKAVKAKGLVQYPLVASWKQAEAVICDWTQLAAIFGAPTSWTPRAMPRSIRTAASRRSSS